MSAAPFFLERKRSGAIPLNHELLPGSAKGQEFLLSLPAFAEGEAGSVETLGDCKSGEPAQPASLGCPPSTTTTAAAFRRGEKTKVNLVAGRRFSGCIERDVGASLVSVGFRQFAFTLCVVFLPWCYIILFPRGFDAINHSFFLNVFLIGRPFPRAFPRGCAQWQGEQGRKYEVWRPQRHEFS